MEGDNIAVHYELTRTKCVSCVNDGIKGFEYVNDEPVQSVVVIFSLYRRC